MSIQLNSNILVAAPAPIDKRYLSERTSGGSPLPYSATTEVFSIIPISQRYTGLTVLITSGTSNVEYWFQNGVTNGNLTPKKSGSGTSGGNFVTGATNIGYFIGYTGVQTLPITNLPDTNYNGNYYSLYNYYYRGTDGNIHVGTPTDGIPKRGYVKTSGLVKSWLWNEYTATGGNLLGWILVDGNIANQVGTFQTGYVYYPPSTPYLQTSWSTGVGYNNGSNVIISAVVGSLTTGSTLSIGGPPYIKKVNEALQFRTIQTQSPNTLALTSNEAFIYLSGATQITQGANVGTGVQVLKGLTGNTLQFRSIQGSGSTKVTQSGNNIIVTTIVSGSTSGVTNASNIGIGTGLFKQKVGNILQFKSLRPSGSTSISQVGNDLVIYSSGGSGGGTYNLASPSICPVGGMCVGTVLTGKTAFELFREILVPELCGIITPPSTTIGLTASGLYEIGCTLSQTVTGTFSRGLINPQYMSPSQYRSGCANAYCFTGAGMPSGFQACALTPATKTNPSYSVVIGTQSWGVCTRYYSGSCAQGNAGTVYAAALPSGCTSAASDSIVGAYPIWATTSTIAPPLTKQPLYNMATATDIELILVADNGPTYKQAFEIPCAWLNAPRPLVGVCQWNTVANAWQYPGTGGTPASSLTIWTCSSSSEMVQGFSVGYCKYTYNSTDRGLTCIRLVF